MFYSSVHAETHSVSPALCHDVVIAAFRSKTMLNLLLGANRDTYPAARRSLAEQTRGDSTWLWLFDLSHVSPRLTPSHTISHHLTPSHTVSHRLTALERCVAVLPPTHLTSYAGSLTNLESGAGPNVLRKCLIWTGAEMSHIRMFPCKQAARRAQTEPRLRINLIHDRIKRTVLSEPKVRLYVFMSRHYRHTW